jgi:hypothetical protein
MSQVRLYKHLLKNELIKNHKQNITFKKPISRSEWLLLSNRNKKNYNRFAMTNNIPVYERIKT